MKMTNGIRISMQYFAEQTKITDLIDPEVMSDMIDAKIESKITVSPFANARWRAWRHYHSAAVQVYRRCS